MAIGVTGCSFLKAVDELPINLAVRDATVGFGAVYGDTTGADRVTADGRSAGLSGAAGTIRAETGFTIDVTVFGFALKRFLRAGRASSAEFSSELDAKIASPASIRRLEISWPGQSLPLRLLVFRPTSGASSTWPWVSFWTCSCQYSD